MPCAGDTGGTSHAGLIERRPAGPRTDDAPTGISELLRESGPLDCPPPSTGNARPISGRRVFSRTPKAGCNSRSFLPFDRTQAPQWRKAMGRFARHATRQAVLALLAVLANPAVSLAQPTPPRLPPPANPHTNTPPERMGDMPQMNCASEMTPGRCGHQDMLGPPPEHRPVPASRPTSKEKPRNPPRPTTSAPPHATSP